MRKAIVLLIATLERKADRILLKQPDFTHLDEVQFLIPDSTGPGGKTLSYLEWRKSDSILEELDGIWSYIIYGLSSVRRYEIQVRS
jgi:hypothetical protein